MDFVVASGAPAAAAADARPSSMRAVTPAPTGLSGGIDPTADLSREHYGGRAPAVGYCHGVGALRNSSMVWHTPSKMFRLCDERHAHAGGWVSNIRFGRGHILGSYEENRTFQQHSPV